MSRVGVAHLHPNFVARFAGFPCGALRRLRVEGVADAVRGALEAERRAESGREESSRALYDLIGGLDRSDPRRRLLITLRRKLFQGAEPDGEALLSALRMLPETKRRTIRELMAAERRLADRYQDLEDTCETEEDHVRRALRSAARDPEFRMALEVASPSLSSSVGKLLAEDGANRTMSAKMERALLRYLSRGATKATPFARLCTVVAGRMVPGAERDIAGGQPGLRLRGSLTGGRKSRVRVNKRLLPILLGRLLREAEIRTVFPVRVNPTLRRVNGVVRFLTGGDGIEVFRRVERSEPVDLALAELDDSELTLGELAGRVSGHPHVDEDRAAVRSFLDHLVGLGLIRIHAGIDEQDPDWAVPLADTLERAPVSMARSVSQTLRILHREAGRYADAGLVERIDVGRTCGRALDTALAELDVSAAQPRGPVFYEDCTSDATAEMDPDGSLRPTVRSLLWYLDATRCLAAPRTEQAEMRSFFERRFGTRGSVDVLGFYEAFHQGHLKEHALRVARGDREGGYDLGNPFGLPLVDAVHAGRQSLSDALRDAWLAAPDREEVKLDADAIHTATSPVDEVPEEPLSYSLFVELLDGRVYVRDGQYLPGFGKYFSRFLYLFPPSFAAELRERNRALGEDLLAEICDDAQFNANLHPQLLEAGIAYPTGQAAAYDVMLDSTRISVAADPGDPHGLRLTDDRSGRRVRPIDLGFMNPRMRPALYQLYCRLGPRAGFKLFLPTRPPEPLLADLPSDAVVRRPRMAIGEDIVIGRQRWIARPGAFPVQEPGETDARFLVRLNRWREANRIPERAFFRVVSDGVPEGAGAQGRGPGTHGYRRAKPQFIDFMAPAFVRLLSSASSRRKSVMLHVEECLPDEATLPGQDGRRFASELVLQVDRPMRATECVPAVTGAPS